VDTKFTINSRLREQPPTFTKLPNRFICEGDGLPTYGASCKELCISLPNLFFTRSIFSLAFSNFGFIYVTAVNPDTTIEVMRAEVEKISSEKVTDSELRNKVNVMITRYFLGNETNASQANILAAYELSGAGYTESAKYTNYMQQVTADEIRDWIGRCPHGDRLLESMDVNRRPHGGQ